MRRKSVVIVLLLFLAMLVSCNKGGDPVIIGAIDKTIYLGDEFIPIEGITAKDYKGRDLTDKIEYEGNVNPNVVGTYYATYTVFDSEKRKAEVTVTIKVEYLDDEAPILTGVGDVSLLLGENFDPLFNVSANDTYEGNLTSEIELSGALDLWNVGTYTLSYQVSDSSGNKAEKERKINVHLNNIKFFDDNLINDNLSSWERENVSYSNNKLSVNKNGKLSYHGNLELDEAFNEDDDYFYRLSFKAKANQEMGVYLNLTDCNSSSEGINLDGNLTDYLYYFRSSSLITDFVLKLEFLKDGEVEISDLKLELGVAKDEIKPVIVLPDYELVFPIADNEVLVDLVKKLALTGVTASDNIDGNLTKEITVDYDEVNFSEAGEYQIRYHVSDKAGNEEIKVRTLSLQYLVDTAVIDDPEFNGELNSAVFKTQDQGEPTLKVEAGYLVHYNDAKVEWGSAGSPFIKGITTADLTSGNWYVLQFDVKANKNRKMIVRTGLALTAEPWIEDFIPFAQERYDITTSFKTIYHLFYLHADKSSANLDDVKIELQLGMITGGSEEVSNPVYLDNMQIYLLSEENLSSSFKVSFNLDGGSPSLDAIVVDKGSLVSKPADPVKEGFEFLGWYLNNELYDFEMAVNKNIVLQAKWEKILINDGKEPVISVPDSDIIAPIGDLEVIKKLALKGVTAISSNDEDLTAEIEVILAGVDIDESNDYLITYQVADSFGNVGTETRILSLMTVTDTESIKDPGFDGPLDSNFWKINSGDGVIPTFEIRNGKLVHSVPAHAGWEVASSPEIKGLTTDDFEPGNWYLFKMDVKAERPRQMIIRMGLALGNDPWREDFYSKEEGTFYLTDQVQTIHLLFFVDKKTSSDGNKGVKVEIQLGSITWNESEEINNLVTIDNAQFYLLKTEKEVTVTFDSAGGNELDSVSLLKGEKVLKPQDPIKEGFVFLGWYLDDSLFNFNTLVTKDLTLTARWEDAGAPILTGVTNEELIVGADFNYLTGITARDYNNEDITANITVSGEVDVWSVGSYLLTYEVIDDNLKSRTVERTITVVDKGMRYDGENLLPENPTSFEYSGILPGLNNNLAISKGAVLEYWNTTGGIFNDDLFDFLLVKLTVKAYAESDVNVKYSLEGATFSDTPIITLTNNLVEQVRYFRITEPLDNSDFKVEFLSDTTVRLEGLEIKLEVGVPYDPDLPQIFIPNEDIVSYVGNEVNLIELAKKYALIGVTAFDDVDGDLTNKITVDTSLVDFDIVGEHTIKLKVKNSQNKEIIIERKLILKTIGENLNFINDPEFNNDLDTTQWKTQNQGNPEFLTFDGNLIHYLTTSGAEWGSAGSPYLDGLNTNILEAGNYYLFKFDVKGTENRSMAIRSGLALDGEPWIEDFISENNFEGVKYNITTDWQTHYFVFYVSKSASYDNKTNIKFEIQLGKIGNEYAPVNNIVYFDNTQFYLLSDFSDVPQISPVKDKQTVFEIGGEVPDFKEYISVYDSLDGEIAVTDEMIDDSEVDYSQAGIYEVVYTVINSMGKEAEYRLEIEIIDPTKALFGELLSDNEKVKMFGRYYYDETKEEQFFYFTASGFEIKFKGTEVEFTLMTGSNASGKEPYVVVFVDEVEYETYKLTKQENTIKITNLTNEEHVVKVLKRSESTDSTTSLKMVKTDGNFLSTDPYKERKIEVIAASSSAGYGNLASNGNETKTTANSDGLKSFATLTANYLDAEVNIFSASGWALVKSPWDSSNNIPNNYDKVNVYSSHLWDHSSYVPDVFIVNIGTNDWSYITSLSTEERQIALANFVTKYVEFIEYLHSLNNDATIVIIYGLMNETNIFDSTIEVYDKLVLEHPEIDAHLIKLPGANSADGIGSGSHPGLITHNKAALQLAEAISGYRDWEYTPPVVDPDPDPDPDEGEEQTLIEGEYFLLDDLEDYLTISELKENYTHRYSSNNHDDEYLTLAVGKGYQGGNAIALNVIGGKGWDLARTTFSLDQTGLTNDYKYFAFWIKAPAEFSKVGVYLYWSGSQDGRYIDLDKLPKQGGFVYIPLSNWSKQATDITGFAVGADLWGSENFTIYVDQFMFIKDPNKAFESEGNSSQPSLDFDHIMVDDFEDYDDEEALREFYDRRIGDNDYVSDDKIELIDGAGYGGSKALKTRIKLGYGLEIIRRKVAIDKEVSSDYKYLAFWFVPDEKIIDQELKVLLYTSLDKKVEKKYDVSYVPLTGGWISVKISDFGLGEASAIKHYAIGYDIKTDAGKLRYIHLDNVIFIKDPIVLSGGEIEEPTELSPYYLVDDLEGYLSNEDLQEKYTHRYNGNNYDDEFVSLAAGEGYDGGNALKFSFVSGRTGGWDLLRTKNDPIDLTGITDDYKYFAFWIKAPAEVDKINVWMYYGDQDSKEISLADLPEEGGFVYIALSKWGKKATDIVGFAIGRDIKTAGTNWDIYLDNFMFVKDLYDLELLKGPVFEVVDEEPNLPSGEITINYSGFEIPGEVIKSVLIDDFSSYATQIELNNYYQHHLPKGTTHNDEHLELGYFGEEESKGIKFEIGKHEISHPEGYGWDLFKTKKAFNMQDFNVSDDYNGFGFWCEVEGNKEVDIYIWLYYENGEQWYVKATPIGENYYGVFLDQYGKQDERKASKVVGFAVGINNPKEEVTLYLDNFAFVEIDSPFLEMLS